MVSLICGIWKTKEMDKENKFSNTENKLVVASGDVSEGEEEEHINNSKISHRNKKYSTGNIANNIVWWQVIYHLSWWALQKYIYIVVESLHSPPEILYWTSKYASTKYFNKSILSWDKTGEIQKVPILFPFPLLLYPVKFPSQNANSEKGRSRSLAVGFGTRGSPAWVTDLLPLSSLSNCSSSKLWSKKYWFADLPSWSLTSGWSLLALGSSCCLAFAYCCFSHLNGTQHRGGHPECPRGILEWMNERENEWVAGQRSN